jgi:hypothetical protein
MADPARPLDVREIEMLMHKRYEDGRAQGYQDGHEDASRFYDREATRRREEGETVGVLGGLRVATSHLEDLIEAQFGVVEEQEQDATEVALRSLLASLRGISREVDRRGLHGERDRQLQDAHPALFTAGLRP